MKNLFVYLVVLVMASSNAGLAQGPDEERQVKQTELDAACEAARQEKLVVVRVEQIEKCVAEDEHPDRASCEQAYANYGERVGNRPPLFYDLPQCVSAHEHRTSYRSSDD